jgi:hypothetical protein
MLFLISTSQASSTGVEASLIKEASQYGVFVFIMINITV